MSIDETTVPAIPLTNDDPVALGLGELDVPENDHSTTRRRRRRRMYCFHCNRPETHSNPYIGSWFYSYFIGMTFGLVHFFGPYRCQCCGRNRLMFADWINPRFHFIKAKNR